MPYALPHWVWVAVVGAVASAAVLRGGQDERIAAVALLIGSLATKALYSHQGLQTEYGVLAIDIGLLAVLTWLALLTKRYWPIFAASFQLLAVVIHLARMAVPSLGGWSYISAGIIFGYLLAGAIAVGTWNAWRDSRQIAVTADDATRQ